MLKIKRIDVLSKQDNGNAMIDIPILKPSPDLRTTSKHLNTDHTL